MNDADPIRARLDDYLDGLLDDAERRAFEAQLATDEQLRREVDLQRRIDDRLRGRFAPAPRIDAPAAPAPLPTTPAPAQRRRHWAAVASVAAILLIAAGAWFTIIRPNLMPPSGQGQVRPMAVDNVYNLMRRRAFEPEWKCETDAEFIAAVQDRLGFPALVQADPPELQVLGWAYAESGAYAIITMRTMILICRVEGGEHVLVFIDRLDADHPPERRDSSDLHLHRRELGELVLYELTPFEEPRVIERFTIPGSSAP